MRFFFYRGADAIASEKCGQSRECFVKLSWIAEHGFEKTELLGSRSNRLGTERDCNDRVLRFKILQMRLEHAKEKIDIVGRLRNFENALVNLFVRRGGSVSPVGRVRLVADLARIRKSDPQGQFACNQINCA